jgi:hypothetical protein
MVSGMAVEKAEGLKGGKAERAVRFRNLGDGDAVLFVGAALRRDSFGRGRSSVAVAA